METYNLKVKNIRLYSNEEMTKVTITFDETIPGISRTDAGEFIQTDVDHISLTRSAFTAQVCTAHDDIALFKACQNEPFSLKDLAILFMGSKLKFNRTFVSAGELVNDEATEHDCYITDIVAVQLTARAEQKLNDALTLG